MRVLQLLVAIILIVFVHNFVMAENSRQNIRTIDGKDFALVLQALPEFGRLSSVDIDLYEIDIIDDGDIWSIYFKDPNAPKTMFGSRREQPAVTVKISKAERKIVKSYINR